MTVTLHHGDCLDVLATLPDNSVDSIVTDPPYGLSDHKPADVVACLTAWLAGEPYVNGGKGFMGKTWDAWVPGPEVWRECYRVLKPGGYLLTFAGSRSYDLMGIALRLAGFRAHPLIGWLYGQGFPKATNLGKMLDKAAGAKREMVGIAKGTGKQNPAWNGTAAGRKENSLKSEYDATAPATPEARQWDGWFYGLQSLKPALEPILMAQKPPDRAMTANVLHWGTGAVNVEACRVGTQPGDYDHPGNSGIEDRRNVYGNYANGNQSPPSPAGRFPPNLLHDGSDAVVAEFPVTTSGSGLKAKAGKAIPGQWREWEGRTDSHVHTKDMEYAGDTGSASRFYPALPYDDEDVETARFLYCAKASRTDREQGLDGLEERRPAEVYGNGMNGPTRFDPSLHTAEGVAARASHRVRNHHPTVKPTALMRWLVRLITPPGGVVLDPFLGSGSTLKAAVLEGFDGIGIEQDAEYLEIARRRIAAAKLPLFT